MAKKSIIARDLKKAKMINKYQKRRLQLKADGQFDKLHLLPRNSSPCRRKNRCVISGRPRSYMRQFGVSRIVFREQASLGNIPGIVKASW
ncbi:MAG: 30S ribosomal protein S14 [Candidatus Saccharibacteria bacterium]|nr:30S ribosomal protein S14 [Candidatus Saccharibacteria bacterium]MCY4010960.1 30S ribosomal protein S14 [Candidatus Saccharibacteria bacterium]MCY4089057.1 30S ribosomal protein S14 [Candidatus Saccharibacteria bacterium]